MLKETKLLPQLIKSEHLRWDLGSGIFFTALNFFLSFFLSFFFLFEGPHTCHMEVPRLRVESEL